VYTTTYIFTGFDHLDAFKTNLFNIVVEGQFIMDILGDVIIKVVLVIPMFIYLSLIILGNNDSWIFILAYLKVKLNLNEVVNIIMMNFIAMNVLNLYISTFLKEPGCYLDLLVMNHLELIIDLL